MRRFVIIGQRASASGDFRRDDIPSTSGRLDVLLRALRASLLVSHGLRTDTIGYLVLLGGPRAPRTLRFDGRAAKYLRPDERSLAITVQKALVAERPTSLAFQEHRPGIAIADGGLDVVIADAGDGPAYLLDERGADVRSAALDPASALVFVGDHLGFTDEDRARIDARGATPLSIGPVSVQADDAIAVFANELDRRQAR